MFDPVPMVVDFSGSRVMWARPRRSPRQATWISDEDTPQWTLVDAEANDANVAPWIGPRPGTPRNGHSLDLRVVTTG